jgi:hypothetical protein
MSIRRPIRTFILSSKPCNPPAPIPTTILLHPISPTPSSKPGPLRLTHNPTHPKSHEQKSKHSRSLRQGIEPWPPAPLCPPYTLTSRNSTTKLSEILFGCFDILLTIDSPYSTNTKNHYPNAKEKEEMGPVGDVVGR